MRLAGKRAIVTGSSRGVGAAVALAFGQEGARVVVNYLDSSEPAQTVATAIEQAGGQARLARADVRRPEDCQTLVQTAVDAFGGLDILVNNAGFVRPAMLHKMSEEQWDQVLEVHLKGAWAMTKAAFPHLAAHTQGRVINVTSVAGMVGTVGQVNYAAAKGGVISLTKSMAREMARYQTCVNALCLGVVATDMTAKIRQDDKLRQVYMERILLKRFAEPQDVTPAFVFLASDEARYITGQVISVDGGYGMI